MSNLIAEVPGLYRIHGLDIFRKTPGVLFDAFPMEVIPSIDAIDRVLHQSSAQSPSAVGKVERPWYMHLYQEDHLMVLFGTRTIELYSTEHRKVESFTVTPHSIYRNGELLYNGGVILMWPHSVFHRIISGEEGSASINFASHCENFDLDTNFNIYDLNTDTGDYRVIRKGSEDQQVNI